MSEIQPTINDIQFRRIAKELLPNFRGKLGSFAFVTDDHMRLVAFDGVTLGGASKVALLESANFTCTPTVPNVEDLDSVSESAILNIHDTKEILAKIGEDVLAEKLDHTITKQNADLDTEEEDGIYFIVNGTNTPNGTSGYLFVHTGQDSVVQKWITVKNVSGTSLPETYYRVKLDGSYTFWFKYIDTADMDVADIARLSKNNTFTKDVEILGELTGPTIEGKLDHTRKVTITDLNTLVNDGIYYINSLVEITNSPQSDLTQFFIHVYKVDNSILQVVSTFDGKQFFRNKQGTSFSEWTEQKITISTATDIIPGIVKISNLPISGDNTTAFSAGGAFEFNTRIDANYKQSQANQEAITNLTPLVDASVKNVLIPDAANEDMVATLDIVSGTLSIPAASITSFGLSRPATVDEIIYKSDRDVFITPQTYRDTVDPIITQKVEEVFGIEVSSGTGALDSLVDNVLQDEGFNAKVEEAAKEASSKFEVVDNASFDPNTAELNTLYLVVE